MVGPPDHEPCAVCTSCETAPSKCDRQPQASLSPCFADRLNYPPLQRQSRRNDCFAPLLRALLSSPGDGSVGPNPTFCRHPFFPLAHLRPIFLHICQRLRPKVVGRIDERSAVIFPAPSSVCTFSSAYRARWVFLLQRSTNLSVGQGPEWRSSMRGKRSFSRLTSFFPRHPLPCFLRGLILRSTPSFSLPAYLVARTTQGRGTNFCERGPFPPSSIHRQRKYFPIAFPVTQPQPHIGGNGNSSGLRACEE